MSQYLRIWQPLTVKWRLLLLFTLKMLLLSGYSHKIPGSIIRCFVTTIEKFCFIVFQKPSLVLRKSSTLEAHKKMCMVEQNLFVCRPKACHLLQKNCYFNPFFLSNSVTAFRSCMHGKVKLHYLVVLQD